MRLTVQTEIPKNAASCEAVYRIVLDVWLMGWGVATCFGILR